MLELKRNAKYICYSCVCDRVTCTGGAYDSHYLKAQALVDVSVSMCLIFVYKYVEQVTTYAS